MPSKNMLPKGKRRQSVKADYRAARDVAEAAEEQRRREADAALFGEAPPPRPAEANLPPAPQPPTERRTKNRRKTGRLPSEKAAAKSAENSAAKSAAIARQKFTSDRSAAPQEDSPAGTGSQGKASAVTGKAAAQTLAPPAEDQQDFLIPPESRDVRLDQFLAAHIPHTSRSRVQLLIDSGGVVVDGRSEKASYKVQPGETVRVTGQPQPPPMRATAEDIPLTVVYEDDDLAAIDKPAGMAVHAGSGATDEARTGGTLVNALLHLFKDRLSNVGGELRPGIVHRLDKETSGLILVAKNDRAHRALAEMFHDHTLEKRYIALVHRIVRNDEGTVDLAISRDPVRRTRMTTRRNESWITTASHGRPSNRHPEEPDEDETPSRRGQEARDATTHYRVLERLSTSVGDFTLLDVEIETGRTHQIRVHMQALGHPVVGDTTYGAPARIRGLEPIAPAPKTSPKADPTDEPEVPPASTLQRNFLHAAHLSLAHPITGEPLSLDAPLPPELTELLDRLRSL